MFWLIDKENELDYLDEMREEIEALKAQKIDAGDSLMYGTLNTIGFFTAFINIPMALLLVTGAENS